MLVDMTLATIMPNAIFILFPFAEAVEADQANCNRFALAYCWEVVGSSLSHDRGKRRVFPRSVRTLLYTSERGLAGRLDELELHGMFGFRLNHYCGVPHSVVSNSATPSPKREKRANADPDHA
jgi:hypothetical protein